MKRFPETVREFFRQRELAAAAAALAQAEKARAAAAALAQQEKARLDTAAADKLAQQEKAHLDAAAADKLAQQEKVRIDAAAAAAAAAAAQQEKTRAATAAADKLAQAEKARVAAELGFAQAEKALVDAAALKFTEAADKQLRVLKQKSEKRKQALVAAQEQNRMARVADAKLQAELVEAQEKKVAAQRAAAELQAEAYVTKSDAPLEYIKAKPIVAASDAPTSGIKAKPVVRATYNQFRGTAVSKTLAENVSKKAALQAAAIQEQHDAQKALELLKTKEEARIAAAALKAEQDARTAADKITRDAAIKQQQETDAALKAVDDAGKIAAALKADDDAKIVAEALAADKAAQEAVKAINAAEEEARAKDVLKKAAAGQPDQDRQKAEAALEEARDAAALRETANASAAAAANKAAQEHIAATAARKAADDALADAAARKAAQDADLAAATAKAEKLIAQKAVNRRIQTSDDQLRGIRTGVKAIQGDPGATQERIDAIKTKATSVETELNDITNDIDKITELNMTSEKTKIAEIKQNIALEREKILKVEETAKQAEADRIKKAKEESDAAIAQCDIVYQKSMKLVADAENFKNGDSKINPKDVRTRATEINREKAGITSLTDKLAHIDVAIPQLRHQIDAIDTNIKTALAFLDEVVAKRKTEAIKKEESLQQMNLLRMFEICEGLVTKATSLVNVHSASEYIKTNVYKIDNRVQELDDELKPITPTQTNEPILIDIQEKLKLIRFKLSEATQYAELKAVHERIQSAATTIATVVGRLKHLKATEGSRIAETAQLERNRLADIEAKRLADLEAAKRLAEDEAANRLAEADAKRELDRLEEAKRLASDKLKARIEKYVKTPIPAGPNEVFWRTQVGVA